MTRPNASDEGTMRDDGNEPPLTSTDRLPEGHWLDTLFCMAGFIEHSLIVYIYDQYGLYRRRIQDKEWNASVSPETVVTSRSRMGVIAPFPRYEVLKSPFPEFAFSPGKHLVFAKQWVVKIPVCGRLS